MGTLGSGSGGGGGGSYGLVGRGSGSSSGGGGSSAKERHEDLDQANQEIERLRKTVEKLQGELQG